MGEPTNQELTTALIGQFESEQVSIRGLRLAERTLHGDDSYITHNVVSVYDEQYGVTETNLKLRGLIRFRREWSRWTAAIRRF